MVNKHRTERDLQIKSLDCYYWPKNINQHVYTLLKGPAFSLVCFGPGEKTSPRFKTHISPLVLGIFFFCSKWAPVWVIQSDLPFKETICSIRWLAMRWRATSSKCLQMLRNSCRRVILAVCLWLHEWYDITLYDALCYSKAVLCWFVWIQLTHYGYERCIYQSSRPCSKCVGILVKHLFFCQALKATRPSVAAFALVQGLRRTLQTSPGGAFQKSNVWMRIYTPQD